MWVILATACLSVVTRCQWICPSSLLHQLSHNCRVCLHCCAATSDFLLLLAIAITHVTIVLERWSLMWHMPSEVTWHPAANHFNTNKMHNMFTCTKVLWPLVQTSCWGVAWLNANGQWQGVDNHYAILCTLNCIVQLQSLPNPGLSFPRICTPATGWYPW